MDICEQCGVRSGWNENYPECRECGGTTCRDCIHEGSEEDGDEGRRDTVVCRECFYDAPMPRYHVISGAAVPDDMQDVEFD
jgi:hypothetical protein